MSASPLKKFLLRPVVLSGAVFCLFSLPLAAVGSNEVTIQLQEEPVFHGKLRDIAAPYLGFATVLSLGVAISSVAMTGWRQSSKKSAQLEDQLSTVKQNLKQTETQIEELKVSELQLQASGLNVFLESGVSHNQQLTSLDATTIAHLEEVATQVQVRELVANAAQSVEPQAIMARQEPVFPAQSVPRSPTPYAPVSEIASETPRTELTTAIARSQSEPLTQIEDLRSQFQQMMSQMETLQKIIVATPQSVTLEAELAANYNYGRNRLERQQPVLESSPISANFNPDREQSDRRRPARKAKRQQQKLAAS
jgi:HAMP domain-containing protein/uncharacterized membrane-anchored protein YhcB (DUF1043 family)